MAIVSAEKQFNQGLEALEDQDFVEAAAHFRRAMDIEHQRHVSRPDMRYLSYYGLCQANAHSKVQEGLHACKRAALTRKQDPEMFLNLGRVYLLARQRLLAYKAFQSGLELAPGHRELVLESERLAKILPPSVTTGQDQGFFSKMRSVFMGRPAPQR